MAFDTPRLCGSERTTTTIMKNANLLPNGNYEYVKLVNSIQQIFQLLPDVITHVRTRPSVATSGKQINENTLWLTYSGSCNTISSCKDGIPMQTQSFKRASGEKKNSKSLKPVAMLINGYFRRGDDP